MNFTAALFSTMLTCATSLAGIYTLLPLADVSSIFNHNHSDSPQSADHALANSSDNNPFIIDTIGHVKPNPEQVSSSNSAAHSDNFHAMLISPKISFQGNISSLKLDHNDPYLLKPSELFAPIVSI